jgi:hypothetical protein
MYFGIYLVLALLSRLVDRKKRSSSDIRRRFGFRKVI